MNDDLIQEVAGNVVNLPSEFKDKYFPGDRKLN